MNLVPDPKLLCNHRVRFFWRCFHFINSSTARSSGYVLCSSTACSSGYALCSYLMLTSLSQTKTIVCGTGSRAPSGSTTIGQCSCLQGSTNKYYWDIPHIVHISQRRQRKTTTHNDDTHLTPLLLPRIPFSTPLTRSKAGASSTSELFMIHISIAQIRCLEGTEYGHFLNR